MAESPKGMTILTVEPHNYDEIIKRSQRTEKPSYTREELERIRSDAYARNTVALVMFVEPGFWRNG